MKRILGVAAVLAVTAFTVAACTDEYVVLSSLAPVKLKYSSTLVGTNEVPPVTTTAAGKIDLVKEDSVNILYELSTTSQTDSITQAHIHAGGAGVVGPVMVWLFPTEASRAAGTGGGTAAAVNGIIRVGRLTKAGTSFVAPFTWDSLVTRINAGTAYANVHTRKNGGGEIRGQITAVTQ
ncbi:MAG: CHRD domain-containing protein [Gemmatimonadaceae bacterium]|nr:CHRD domain-containing protein [Gemmatimonadaceae bacterium]